MRGMARPGTLALVGLLVCASWSRAEGTWFDEVIRRRGAPPTGKPEPRKAVALPDFGNGSYTFTAWIRTTTDGSIFAKTAPRGPWVRHGKALFVKGGRAHFDVGWVGTIKGRKKITDGRWHHVAFTGGSPQLIYIDGALDARGGLRRTADVKGSVLKLGHTSANYPSGGNEFRGEFDDVRVYARVLSAKEIKAHFRSGKAAGGRGLVAYWPFDGDTRDASGSLNHAAPARGSRFVAGRFGKALKLTGSGYLTVRCGDGASPDAELWAGLGANFGDPVSTQEMQWEREDGVWRADWKTVGYSEVAKRYAGAAKRPSSVAVDIRALASRVSTVSGLRKVRELYLGSKRYDQLLEKIAEFKLKELRATIAELYAGSTKSRELARRLDALEGKAARWEGGPPGGKAFEDWKSAVAKLRSDVILNENPLVDFDKIVFVKRYTYSANHYYTEYLNSRWMPGGGLCVLEQVPRPWATRRRWGGDGYDQQHVVVTKDTHLGLKVQHGIVPVEDDGSAHFVVPARRNIILQALDGNYMAVQTERTYVNYMPGETRSCVGCHETPRDAATAVAKGVVKALTRPASVPGPQPGEKTGGRALHFPADVQPVLDKHCVKCHSGKKPKADLRLTGDMTALFSVSYESLIPERRRGRGRRRFELVGPTIGENHPKTGNVHYMPAKSFGSHNSVLVAMLSKGKVRLKDPKKAETAARLAAKHKDLKLKPEELLKITNWVDTNSQFHGSYWGRKNLRYKDHPNFRPAPTYEVAQSMTSPIPEEKR